MIDILQEQKVFDTLFLLFLGTVGGFIGGGITSCQVQKIIRDSVYVKQLIFFIIIFFTNSFVQESTDTLATLKRTMVLYLIFIVLMKNNYKSVSIVVVILLINKIFSQSIDNLNVRKEKEPKNKEIDIKIANIQKITKVLTVIAGIAMFYGFIHYYFKKKEEYGKGFKLLTFLMGSNKCKSMA